MVDPQLQYFKFQRTYKKFWKIVCSETLEWHVDGTDVLGKHVDFLV